MSRIREAKVSSLASMFFFFLLPGPRTLDLPGHLHSEEAESTGRRAEQEVWLCDHA